MLRQLARVIVSRYPAAWRERYADEVLDLIDNAPVRVFDVGELFRNMLLEQVRAAVDLERPTEAATKVMRWKFFAVGMTVVVTLSTSLFLRWARPLSAFEVERVTMLALMFWLALLGLWAMHTWRQRRRAKDDRSPFPVWVAIVCLPAHLLATTCWLWAGFIHVSDYSYSLQWMKWIQPLNHSLYLGGPVSAWLMMQIWPGQRLVQLLTEFQLADGAVEGAKGYIASCEEWIAKGVPSPLSDAKVALEQRILERDVIRERLDKFSARSRLLQS